MARGRSGVISKEYKGEENTAYHDVIKLFKIYRAVNWQMQIKINRVKRRFHMEYGTDVDEFLESIYQAGMDVERDLASEKERVEAINRSNQYLRLIDEAVDLMRRYHPQGSGIIGYFITVIYRQQNQRTLMKSWTSWNYIFRNMQEFTGLHIFVGVNRLLKL